jgi:hypothetical protein
VLAILAEILGQLGFGWVAWRRWGPPLIVALAVCCSAATGWIVVEALS